MSSDVTDVLAGQGSPGPECSPGQGCPKGLRLPELLAPAGDWECARAAVENGADAIYFGLERFNARMRAANFTEADLPKLMEFLHQRGVKGYVTFNTLVFENEMAVAEQYARSIIAAGADAAIVQDVGICRLMRALSSDFPIHVSTQMTVTSAAGIEFARQLGCNLVVLARECSLKEIAQLTGAALAVPNESALPIEVFVHGALCVAYSGQCLTSEALGGRSANRGECAQACRMPYELIADGKPVALGDRKYLLSPQDLAGLELLPELARLGVASLKIEGRLKSPEYVANITRIYREALDQLCEKTATSDSGTNARNSSRRYKMEMAFSRGLYTGWFGGINNQQLVHGRFGKKRGVYLGQVLDVHNETVLVRLEGPLKPGDGVVFDAGKPEHAEEGGRVYGVKARNGASGAPMASLTFGRGDINFARVQPGDKLWKTSDPALERSLRQSFEGKTPKFARPVSIQVYGKIGEPLILIVRDELGHVARMESQMPLVKAEQQPLTTERFSAQLGRLGGTPFELGALQNLLEGPALVPLSELNRLRREMVERLSALRAQPLRWSLKARFTNGLSPSSSFSIFQGFREPERGSGAQLIVLVRNLSQLDAALGCGIETVYCEFEDPKKYREAVLLFRCAPNRSPHSTIWVAPPRIFKSGEEWVLKQVRSCEADGYLLRNYDHLSFFKSDRRIGDYSFNVANSLAADYFKSKFGLERLTPSYDLNFTQLEALLRAAPPEWFEVTIHQHIPMFHMEHCVFCAFLSKGTDFTNCGRPCDRHDVKLRDRAGTEHPIKADAGCRNTVFNSMAQTGAEYVTRMRELGVRHFRMEFLNETPLQVTQTIGKYRQLIEGEITGSQLWRELKLFNQLGVTRGQMAGKGP
ncbi:MAG TPA: DUF3656 domain-containing protein [Verrucomicrobiae bacterium]|nr:DUF3656 domain-containing protein [Verrucomicrobiae bacterium]